MIFQHTLQQVLDGTKTQTSRIVKPGEYAAQTNDGTGWANNVYLSAGRAKWRVGNDYAVQPGRGKKAVARIRILKIRHMDVWDFTLAEYANESVGSGLQFMSLWIQMHGRNYQAWVLNFELVQ